MTNTFLKISSPNTHYTSYVISFYQVFLSQTLTKHRTAGEQSGSSFVPFYHFHPLTNIQDIYLQLRVWDEYHIFLIATLVFTRLLLNEIYHLIELSFDWLIDWLMMQCLFVYLMIWYKVFVTAIYFIRETGGFVLALTIYLVLQANRLTNCTSHPKVMPHKRLGKYFV